MGNVSLLDPGKDEVKREADRQARFAKMRIAVDIILREIDACGILRKPTWDGVRVLLLLLPLTEGVSTCGLLPLRLTNRNLFTCRATCDVRECIITGLYAMLLRRSWVRWQSSRDIRSERRIRSRVRSRCQHCQDTDILV
jgi:hypothetical protein